MQLALWSTGLGGQQMLVAELIQGFQRKNPDILVATEWRSSEHAQAMVRRWTGSYRDHAPDLVVLTDLWLPEHAGDIAVLPKSLARAVRKSFPASVLARGGDPAEVIGVPWVVATEALYYRSDLMAEAELSPPTTFEELAHCAAELTDPPHCYGLGVPGSGMGGEELVHVLATAMGPPEPDEVGAFQPVLQPFADALSLLVDIQGRGGLQPEVLTWSEMELAGLMTGGRLGMMIARPWLGTMLARAETRRQVELDRLTDAEDLDEEDQARVAELRAAKIEWGTVALPVAEGGVGHMTVDWLVMLRSTDKRDAAVRLMSHMAAKNQQLALAVLGGVPATTELLRDTRNDPRWPGHSRGLTTARGLPTDQWERLGLQLGDALGHTISGRRTPVEALQRAAEIN